MLEVFFIGTGGIMPTKERNVSSLALKYNGEVILFDCGEGTQRQMQHTNVSPMDIEKIFITHFHGDHYIGVLPLIQTMSLLDREKPLHIYGPRMTKKFIKNLLTSGFLGLEFSVKVHELNEETLDMEGYSISSFKTDHLIPSLGYVFQEDERRGRFDLGKAEELGLEPGPKFKKLENGESVYVEGSKIDPEDVIKNSRKGRKITYSGDTKPLSKTVDNSKNSDLLIHECTFLDEDERKDSYHTVLEEVIDIAERANVKKLALVHRSPRYKHHDFLDGISERIGTEIEDNKIEYEGIEILVPKDLDSVQIKLE